ncbi:MAG: hypothetical protein LC792_12050 [Actinobacteria bacterium]|nr:hypothetical protein [Actinomycetota bacterium]
MRRIVATLLVVASPLLLAAPVNAQDRPAVGPTAAPAATAPVQGVAPAAPAPITLAPPAVPSATAAGAAVAPPVAPLVTRAAVNKAPAAKARPALDLNDSAYAARLQADLCQARQIFCGLDRSGHYPAG